MRKTRILWLLAVIFIFACSPTTQIQDSVGQALTETQAALPTVFPTFTPAPTRTPYPTRTPMGGGSLPVVTPRPPTAETPSIGETATASGPSPSPSLTPSPTHTPLFSTPTLTPNPGGYPPPSNTTSTPTSVGGYPPPSVSTFTPSPTLPATPTPSTTIDPLYTPSLTPSPTITPSPTFTITPNGSFTPTKSPTPTQSRTPTRTLTPTRTPGPSPTSTLTLTPTPALPDLTTLIIDTDDLNAVENLWDAPPENITEQLQDLGGEVCDVVCIGLDWTSLDTFDSLVLVAYRTIDFEEAVQVAYSAQFVYLAQGFELETLPPGVNLPAHTWVASKWNQDFVIFTSQGPAVLSFFWHADSPISTDPTIALIAEYMDIQAEILRLNGYITVDPNATPLP